MYLSNLRPGERARIAFLDTQTAIEQRIAAFGLMCGEIVEVTRIAPMGDPMAVWCAGTEIMLRKSEAGSIRVNRL